MYTMVYDVLLLPPSTISVKIVENWQPRVWIMAVRLRLIREYVQIGRKVG